MRLWKRFVLFYLGGSSYMTLEFLWRGRSHGSMFLLGGFCFCILGKMGKSRLPMAVKTTLGAATVTGLELLTGLAVNRDYGIWDYRAVPFNFRGQICLPYCLLWLPVSLAGICLHQRAEQKIIARISPAAAE